MAAKNRPQVKICGLTRVEDALACIELGADALGFIFFPKSPRHLSRKKASEIVRSLPGRVTTVGVFVNESYETIMDHIKSCGLAAVQLHGGETPGLVNRLRDEKIHVIKALFTGKHPEMSEVSRYNAHAYLVECGKGKLPGGNALAWNWGEAKPFGEKFPLILAGGLSPENVISAVTQSLPDAVDISSGVEMAPGVKDIEKVKKFIGAVSSLDSNPMMREKKYRKVLG